MDSVKQSHSADLTRRAASADPTSPLHSTAPRNMVTPLAFQGGRLEMREFLKLAAGLQRQSCEFELEHWNLLHIIHQLFSDKSLLANQLAFIKSVSLVCHSYVMADKEDRCTVVLNGLSIQYYSGLLKHIVVLDVYFLDIVRSHHSISLQMPCIS